jgi:mannose-6-phosphate isomerase
MTRLLPILPLRLDPNPVWRSYLGGKELRRFRGLPPAGDDHFPEDWLASTVRAKNGPNSQGKDEGISRVTVDGRNLNLPDAFREHPEYWWGDRPRIHRPADETGVLIKFLDAQTRLHLQAHPDAGFVSQRFGGNAGKTECWYILSTRHEDAYVYLGFQRPPSRSQWARMIRDQDLDGMLACFDRIPVKAGDCFAVPAGTPHAIGEGILMIELQEPTDWVVRCEFEVGGYRLPESARYMGLDLDACLDVFNYVPAPVEDVLSRFRQLPREITGGSSYREFEVIQRPFDRFFRLRTLTGTGEARCRGGELAVLIVVRGKIDIACDEGAVTACAGSAWLLPGSAVEWQWLGRQNEPWEVVLAQPPTDE